LDTIPSPPSVEGNGKVGVSQAGGPPPRPHSLPPSSDIQNSTEVQYSTVITVKIARDEPAPGDEIMRTCRGLGILLVILYRDPDICELSDIEFYPTPSNAGPWAFSKAE
jgi:hypothetical protein